MTILASVIVPCSGPIIATRRCLEALARQTRRYELIVVVDGSRDRLSDYLAGMADVAPFPITILSPAGLDSFAAQRPAQHSGPVVHNGVAFRSLPADPPPAAGIVGGVFTTIDDLAMTPRKPTSRWLPAAGWRSTLPENRVGTIETIGRPWVREPDVDILTEQLRHVARDRVRAKATGAAAATWIRGNFTWAHAAEAAEARLRALATIPKRPKEAP